MSENTFLETGENTPEETLEKKGSGRHVAYGIAFVGGMGAATAFNMSGYPGIAMGFGMVGLIGLATFIGTLRKDD